MKTLLSMLGLLLGLMAFAMLLLFLLQRHILYPAPPFALPKFLPDNVTRIDFANSYGLLMVPEIPDGKASPMLIFTHGNGEMAFHWIEES